MRILFLGFGGSIALTMHSAWGEFREKYAADTTTRPHRLIYVTGLSMPGC